MKLWNLYTIHPRFVPQSCFEPHPRFDPQVRSDSKIKRFMVAEYHGVEIDHDDSIERFLFNPPDNVSDIAPYMQINQSVEIQPAVINPDSPESSYNDEIRKFVIQKLESVSSVDTQSLQIEDDVDDCAMPMVLAPTIFSLREYKFMNEINGLLNKSHVTLYGLIENVFMKFIPLFEYLLQMKLMDSPRIDQLEVIIKMEEL